MDKIMYNIALVTHIAGITIMAGTTFIDYITFRQFWKVLPTDRVRSLVLEEQIYRLQRFMGIGMVVILASGIGMMAYLHQVWGQQTWFRIKMGLLLLIIINGLAFRRRMGTRLKKLLNEEGQPDLAQKLSGLKSSIGVVHGLQLLLFTLIYVLSVFKFN